MSGIFKAYDVRGIYGEELTNKDAYLIGYYLAKSLNVTQFKVSHDMRLSYENLTKCFIQGLLDAQVEVIYLGANSTPCFYYSLFEGVNSGVQISASHNSKEYNGFKFMINGTSFDSRNGLEDLERIVQDDENSKSEAFDFLEESILAESLTEFLIDREIEKINVLDNYVSYLEEFSRNVLTDKDKLNLSKLRLGFDFSNGMSSLAVSKLVEILKLNCFLLNDSVDGSFPAHLPEPKHSEEFLKNHIAEKFDLVVSFDGDGDRLGVVDENKNFVLMDYIIALFVDYFIHSTGSKSFVCDLRASRVIGDIAKEKGAKVNLLRVGRSFYQDFLTKYNCKFGGELSGHMFFKDFHNLDNPDVALIYFLKILANNVENEKEFSFENLIRKYKTYTKIPEKNLVVSDADKIFELLKDKYSKNLIMEMDGLSFDFGDYWFNIRKSNTEPKVRINFEGLEEKKTVEEFKKFIEFVSKY